MLCVEEFLSCCCTIFLFLENLLWNYLQLYNAGNFDDVHLFLISVPDHVDIRFQWWIGHLQEYVFYIFHNMQTIKDDKIDYIKENTNYSEHKSVWHSGNSR